MEAIKFSFIIPHYNIDSDLLMRCLNSIPLQDNIQIIIVDDHSPLLYKNHNDRQELQIHRANLEFFNLEKNQGPGYARNFGLSKAKGEWVFFCDADDFYETTGLSNLMALCLKSNDDIIFFGYNSVENNKSQQILYGFPSNEKTLIRVNVEEKDIFLNTFYPWQKVYRKDFIRQNKLKFEELYLSEDRLFSLNSLLLSDKISRYSCPVYNYCIRDNSLVYSRPTLSRSVGALIVSLKVNKILKSINKFPRFYDTTSKRYLLYVNKDCKILYWCFVFQEIVQLGWNYAMEDRSYVCLCNGNNPNIFYQLIAPIRVFLGRQLNRIC